MDSGTVTAAYLQGKSNTTASSLSSIQLTVYTGRIATLTTHLRSRMLNIFYLVEPPEHHSITSIATDQFRMDVESTALIRAAEEVMVLTRELKDLWLFGGLDTQRDGKEDDAKMEEDAKVVYEFLQKTINGDGGRVNGKAAVEGAVDGEMETEAT
jgi:Surfeit locus protein 5 subunit 22 of Mediator complex